MPGYFALLILFTLFFGLSFYFGVSEWRRPRDDTPLPVDVEYVRVENYFGVSFRAKMQEWLNTAQLLQPVEPWTAPVRQVLQRQNGERIVVLRGGTFSGSQEQQELIYCEGNLSVSGLSVFNKEIYALGGIQTGAGAQLQALAADGEIILGPDNDVSRWVDAHKRVLLRHGTVVHSRVSSLHSIELEQHVSAQSLYAPVIFTAGCELSKSAAGEPAATTFSADPVPDGTKETPACFKGKSVSRLSRDTWLARGDLEFGPGMEIPGNLVVRGKLRAGRDCFFIGSVKADEVELGLRNRVSGNVVSSSSLKLGEGSRIRESVVAETEIILSTGVRVGEPSKAAVVSAGTNIRMGVNVAVFGKVAAGRAIITD